ncbi:MAG: penicillin acylase family protein [Thermodesulfobacteriota bacterium]
MPEAKQLNGKDGSISIRRNEYGIPEISAESFGDAFVALGYMHARDRQLQMMLTRILLQGRASELLADDPALVEIDRYMRRMRFLPDAADELARLSEEHRNALGAYADGVNRCLSDHGRIWEFRLMRVPIEPWKPEDTLILAKIMGFLGLADVQGNMEKFLVQMVQNGIPEAKIRELFPYLCDSIDVERMKAVRLKPPIVPEALSWLRKLPHFCASNNWVVAGQLTRTGRPILCNDPHLEVNRLPAIWYEVVMRIAGRTVVGITLPGAPAVAAGRTPEIAWGVTYSFMDQIDFRIERCRNGCYFRDEGWTPFRVREERIRTKKGRILVETVYENEWGLLEGDPSIDGEYLVMQWSCARKAGAGDIAGMFDLMKATRVDEAIACFRKLECLSFNWVVADRDGRIGYQMSGRMFRRPEGVSGLMPTPAWDRRFHPTGWVDPMELPCRIDPQEGFIVTANQDLNGWGTAQPINLAMAAWRADRITDMLRAHAGSIDADTMQSIQTDLLSLQATVFMDVLRPFLPNTEAAERLSEWDCRYDALSTDATRFEAIYQELIEIVFGDHGMGRDVLQHIMSETSLFNDYYGNFDAILLKKDSAWFDGRRREDILREAIEVGLSKPVVPYGETRRINLNHLLFGGKLPRFLGFDYGPIQLPGNRATVAQGQIFRSAGRQTTFSPSWRMIADFSRKELLTSLPGGPSDRRFSPYYTCDIDNWRNGRYKLLG